VSERVPSRTAPRRTAVCLSVIVVALTAIACTEEQRGDLVDQGAEAVVRNVVAAAGAGAFEREGVEVEGSLDCTASSTGGAERLQVHCTGSSKDGEELVLEGEASTGDAEPGTLVRGSFVGTVDGEQVFEQDCLGDAC
jgi:hypothetical protein